MIGKIPLAALLAIAPAALAQSLAGRWDATVTVNGVDIPFRFELAGPGANIKGSFFNGDERLPSTAGKFENGSLTLAWDYFASRLEASLKNGALEGTYTQARRAEQAVYAFRARRFEAQRAGQDAPSIGGLWTIPNNSPKGERAWRFIVHQSGGDVSAAILRVDGDTGALTGTYRDGKFVISHFSGVRPLLLELSLTGDGTLDILENGKTKLTAVRAEQARAKGVPDPTDPTRHTSVKDLSEPFRFSFPDLNGHIVSNTDARFRGKVVLVNITGSWCPNCHDEAPFLAALYKKYRDQGLEIVALSFEEGDQLKDPARLRAFIQRYGIEYTVLLCGEPGDAAAKLTQAVNWNSWPTTFFLGRDGRVRSVHAGFPSSASGELYRQAKDEFTAQVEGLLRENMRTAR
ncbi:MAG TPA: TlpA disulfide reductase family protein [Bryobacteraceae bacterium]|nr:TlpA disulfide reductase family protein [Bryobacteraceae bacterium]